MKSWKNLVALFLVGLSLTSLIASCTQSNPSSNTSGSSATGNSDVELTLASFFVTRAAQDAILPKFAEKWQKEKGQKVTFKPSYAASGAQARAVMDGLEADVVYLALASDTDKISQAGLIEPGWEKEFPNNSIVSKSVTVLVTRDGNPKGIKTWNDLAKNGVSLINTDPKISGVARWIFLTLWNSVLKAGGNETQALDFVTKVYKNAIVLTKDAREATDIFLKQGQGDALINYENEMILAKINGAKVNYVIPEVNISIDNPVAIVDKNVDKHKNREVAEAYVKYLFTEEAQREFAKVGFRPVVESMLQDKELAARYPKVKNLSTIQDYGGWGEVQTKFFGEGAIYDQIVAKNGK